MGTLFVIATPIGNMSDLSARAIETLRECPLVVAEDTRHTGQLLKSVGASARQLSFNEHNVSQRIDPVMASLLTHDVALVTDAGTPAISDPGYQLVAAAHEHGYPVRTIPGPSAVVAALSVAGLPATPFTFYGYAPRTAGEIHAWIELWIRRSETIVFFESPNRIARTLTVLAQIAPDCSVSICRELTKIHEQVVKTTSSRALELIADSTIPARGEFVVVAKATAHSQTIDPEALIAELLSEGASANQAAKTASNMTGLPKSDLYRIALDQKAATRSGSPASDDA